jgi:precorrin-6A/cobalt-precorrin-6A reductase
MRVLILGGTAEARVLAGRLHALGVPAVTSLAGRTPAPRLPGETRTGGFGGAQGLARYVAEHDIDAIVDATHPFARQISANAATAAHDTQTPLLRLERPGWHERPGDRWHRVASITEAASALSSLGTRALMTTGHTDLHAFADAAGTWLLIRAITPPAPPLPPNHELILANPPFTLDQELALIDEHAIDLVVTKDSGGTAAKLDAARLRAIPVLMVDRPPAPATATANTPQDAARWVIDSVFPAPSPRARPQ